jgi:hypothetical protein
MTLNSFSLSLMDHSVLAMVSLLLALGRQL